MSNDKLQDLRGRIGLTTDNLQEQEAQKALNQIAQQQALQNEIEGNTEVMPQYSNGKSGIPKMSLMSNVIPNAIGGLASAYQYFDAANQDIRVPDVYAGNPYASAALQDMSKIKINPYSTMRQMYDSERRNKYAMSRTGGLTGGQKYAAQVAAGIGTQQNIGKMLNEIQAQNNAYRTAYNQARLQAGESIAQRQQNANQFREQMAASAHASQTQMKQMGMRNFMDYLTNFAASEYKRKQGNAMLDLYQQQLDMDAATLEAMRNYGKTPTTTTPTSTSIITKDAPWIPIGLQTAMPAGMWLPGSNTVIPSNFFIKNFKPTRR